jgi:hypothetical protein
LTQPRNNRYIQYRGIFFGFGKLDLSLVSGRTKYIVTYRPISRQRLGKHSRGNEYTGNNRITSDAMQSAVNTTTEEEVFSMWFAYIHCYAMGVFSMDSPRDYVSNTEQNRIRENENENETGASSQQSRKKGSAED